MGSVLFQLDLPNGWRLHPVFHASKLKPAFGYLGDCIPDSGFRPPVDDMGEFEARTGIGSLPGVLWSCVG